MRQTILLLIFVLGFVPAVCGQGSRADYERAASMRAELRGPIRNERLTPVWLPDGSLIVRIDDATGHRFLRIDASDGGAHSAFDHDAVADACGVAADAIGARSFVVTDGGRVRFSVETEDGSKAFTIALDGTDLQPTDNALPKGPATTDATRSQTTGPEVHLTFVNTCDSKLALDWIDFDGRPVRYAMIDPGASHTQHTFGGHVWRVSGILGIEFARYEAPPHDCEIPIDNVLRSRPAERDDHAQPSATGKHRIAVLQSSNVVTKEMGEEDWTALTTDGSDDEPYEPPLLLSPDERHLACTRRSGGEARRIHLIEAAPDGVVQPVLHELRYPKPGDDIWVGTPTLLSIDDQAAVTIDSTLFPTPWSFTDVRWSSDGEELFFIYNERGHRVRRVIGVDRTTGDARAIIDESSETFIDYSQKTHLTYLEGADELVWMSERDGWNHLYLIDRRSASVVRQLTEGSWVVRSVLDVDAERRTVTFRAMGVYPSQDPYHVHIGRVALDSGDITWLTDGDGTHEVRFSPDGSTYLDSWSRVDHPPVHELRRTSDGSLIREVVRADWSALLATGWRPPERFVSKGRDGETAIWGVIWVPSVLDESASYPVVEYIYAGPQNHHVPKRFSAWHPLRGIAELGFVVVQIDGMGTNWRSKRFHDVCWKNLGDAGFPDRIPWIRDAARTRPYMDLDRVGIVGGSAGGQNAMRALLFHNDFYHVAAADCGCHDNRMDKVWWNEAWMGWPVDASYEASSNVVHAHRLEGDLLLIVGAMDRNVDPASTMQVVDALIKADKDFDLLVMPSVGHSAAGTAYGWRRQCDFLVRKLLGVEPRWEAR